MHLFASTYQQIPETSHQYIIKSQPVPSHSPRSIHSQLTKSYVKIQPNPNRPSSCFSKTMKKQYRNATFIGTFLNNSIKNGLGLLLKDTNEIIFGHWEQDKLVGQTVYISERVRLFGKIGDNGLLQGFHVIKIMDMIVNKNNSRFNKGNERLEKFLKGKDIQPMTIYGTYKQNKLYGKCVILLKEYIYICNIRIKPTNPVLSNENEQYQPLQIIQKIKYTRNELSQTLHYVFPYIKVFELNEYLQNMIQIENGVSKAKQYEDVENNMGLSKYKPVIIKYPINIANSTKYDKDYKIFYGYSTHKYTFPYNQSQQKYPSENTLHKSLQFGFILYNEQLVSIGEHSQGKVHGMATLYELPNKISDGMFKDGKLNGIGLCLDMREGKNKYIYGKYSNNDSNNGQNYSSNYSRYQSNNPNNISSNLEVIKQGINWPEDIIKQYRKQHHIKSIYFDPNYSEIQIQLPIEQLLLINLQLTRQPDRNSHYQSYRQESSMQIEGQLYNKSVKNKSMSKNSERSTGTKKLYSNPNPNITAANKFPITPQRNSYNSNYNTQKRTYNFLKNFDDQDFTQQSRNKVVENKQYQSLYYNFIKSKQNKQDDDK